METRSRKRWTDLHAAIPAEILVQILQWLDSSLDLLCCALVSKTWYAVSRDDSLWRRFAQPRAFQQHLFEQCREESAFRLFQILNARLLWGWCSPTPLVDLNTPHGRARAGVMLSTASDPVLKVSVKTLRHCLSNTRTLCGRLKVALDRPVVCFERHASLTFGWPTRRYWDQCFFDVVERRNGISVSRFIYWDRTMTEDYGRDVPPQFFERGLRHFH